MRENKTTIVSMFFDLCQLENNPKRRSAAKYYELSKSLLKNDVFMFFIGDSDSVYFVESFRSSVGLGHKTYCVTMSLSDSPYIKASLIPIRNERGWSTVKDTPLYSAVTMTKFHAMSEALRTNPFDSDYFAWVDFGISHIANPCLSNIITNLNRRVKIQVINYTSLALSSDRVLKYSIRRTEVCGGFFGGHKHAISVLAKLFDREFKEFLSADQYNTEEGIVASLIALHPDLFDIYYGDYRSIFSNLVSPVDCFNRVKQCAEDACKSADSKTLQHIKSYSKDAVIDGMACQQAMSYMSEIIITAHSPEIVDVCTDLEENKRQYATKFAMDYECGDGSFGTFCPMYQKLYLIQRALDRYSIVVWADMDVAFTNFSKDITKTLSSLYSIGGIGHQRDGINAGLMVIRSNDTTKALFHTIIAHIETLPDSILSVHPCDQTYINSFAKTMEIPVEHIPVDKLGVCEAHGTRPWVAGDLSVHIAIPERDWSLRNKIFVEKYKPLITWKDSIKIILVSMVRNESKIIARMIRSALPIVDAVVVVDTGSTDNTIEEVQRACGDTTLMIAERPWVDFGHNRTQTLEAGRQCVRDMGWNLASCWLLLLDGDHVLRIEPSFSKNFNTTADTIRLVQDDGRMKYRNARLLRASSLASYKGRTHEFLSHEGVVDFLDSLWIEDHNDGGCKSDKFQRDLVLLEKDWRQLKDGRTAFYTAQTYFCLKDWKNSSKWYSIRIEMAEPHEAEEAWYSILQRGRCLKNLKDNDAAEILFARAFAQRPARAEPLHELAAIKLNQFKHAEACALACIGLASTADLNATFIDKYIYDWEIRRDLAIGSWYIKDMDGGRNQCEYLRVKRGSPHREWALENYTFYVEKIPAKIIDIPFTPEPGWSACNPSILGVSNDYLICVRTVNYRIDHGHTYVLDFSGKVKTRNFLLRVDNEFKAISSVELETPVAYSSAVEGLEDVRLYTSDSSTVTGLANRSDWAESASRVTPRMRRCVWDLDGKCISTEPIELSETNRCEKNWLPFVCGAHLAIYWHEPFQIFNLDNKAVVLTQKTASLDLSGFRGSSAPIPWDGGLLYSVHEVCRVQVNGLNKFYYMHRLCWMTLGGGLQRFSRLFYFDTLGVEFCAGMSIHEFGVVMTFGVHDCAAKIALVPRNVIEEYLSHNTITV